jgi:molybdate transport system substrate-binding protein
MKTLIAASRQSMTVQVLRAVMVLAASVSTAGTCLAADISVFSSGAPADVAKVMAAGFTRDTGHHIAFTVANPAGIQRKLASGETPDILVLPSPVIDLLEQGGTLRPQSRVDVARVGVGVVVRAGAALPDISTVDAVRKALLDARSIVYPDPGGGGFTGTALARMMVRLGIADAVEPKATRMQAIAGGVALVAKGEVELGLFNISEVLPVAGVTLAGPLPSELQSYIVFTAAIHAGSVAPAAAAAFIKLLSGPAAREHWKAGGLESLGGGS